MKKSIYILIAISAGLLYSCAKEDKALTETETPPQNRIVFTATTEPATKTALEADGSGGYNVAWRSGDQIAISNSPSSWTRQMIYSTTSNTTHADFTYVSGDQWTGEYYAFYPADWWTSSTAAYPVTQYYVPGNIPKTPMAACSNTTSLQFRNIGGLVKINLKTTLSGQKVQKIYLYSESNSLSGSITNMYQVMTADPPIAATMDPNSPAQHPVVLECGNDGVAIGSDPTPFYIAVPATTYTSFQISVITTEGIKQDFRIKSDRSVVVERSAVTNINLTFTKTEEIIDLSEKESANTYMVTESGYYKFKATVKGNGGLDPVTGTKATEINKSDISGVVALWEVQQRGMGIRFDSNIQEYELSYHDGYVYFHSLSKGAVYVAVYKDKEGGTEGVYDKDIDEILWSWLIWSTYAPGKIIYNGNAFMDRNIGSLYEGWWEGKGYNGGFSYQWGRPAPFATSLGQAYTPFNYIPQRTNVFSFENIGNGTTVEHASSHPVTFFYHGSRSNWMPDNATCMTLWSDNVKTIYDPSPIGWKVPSKAQLTGITSAMSFYGTGFIGPACSSDFGYGNPGSVLLWSSTCDDSDGFIGAWANAYGSMYKKYGGWPDVYMMSGMPIRPVQDEASMTYADLSAEETANCYIISSSGDYKFKATVRGNGAATLAGVSKNISPSEIASANLLWASYGTSTAPAEAEMLYGVRYEDGYVYFHVPETFHEGNAVIAIKNSGGTILWSWHLWFTTTDLASLAQTYNSGAVFMDRNLGALTRTHSNANTFDYGLMYQWGRKDPFQNAVLPGFNDGYVSSSDWATCYIPATLGAAEQRTIMANPTVASMVAYPTTFSRGSYANSNFDYDNWATDITEDLWQESKTIFDPCPSGWKVPDKSAWNDQFVVWLDGHSFYQDGFYIDEGGIKCRFPGIAARMPNAVYGYHGSQSYKLINGEGALERTSNYHVIVWAQNGVLLKEKFYYEENGGGMYGFTPNPTGIYNYSDFGNVRNLYKTRGGSVRCVRE